jgi:hypothetical protein
MSGDHAGLIPFRAFPEMLMVNRPDVATANGGGLGLEEYLSISRNRNLVLSELNGAIAGKYGTGHLRFAVNLGHAHISVLYGLACLMSNSIRNAAALKMASIVLLIANIDF